MFFYCRNFLKVSPIRFLLVVFVITLSSCAVTLKSPTLKTIPVRDLVEARVIVIPESAYLEALKAHGYAGSSEKSRKAAVRLAAYANDPNVRRLRAKIDRSAQEFSGELFVVVRNGQSIEGGIETTDFYVAAVQLSGQASWVGHADNLMRGPNFNFDPLLNCCSKTPGGLGGVCTPPEGGEIPRTGPCGGPFAACGGIEGTACLERSNPTIGNFDAAIKAGMTREALASVGLAVFDDSYCPVYDAAPLSVGSRAPLQCQICSQIQCPPPEVDTPGERIIETRAGCSGFPEICTQFISSPEYLPPECGGFCTTCFENDSVCEFGTYPGSDVCQPKICTLVNTVDPTGDICTGPPPPMLAEGMALLGQAGSCETVGPGSEPDTTCCGKGCTCKQFGPYEVCVQCYEDGTCSRVPPPSLVDTGGDASPDDDTEFICPGIGCEYAEEETVPITDPDESTQQVVKIVSTPEPGEQTGPGEPPTEPGEPPTDGPPEEPPQGPVFGPRGDCPHCEPLDLGPPTDEPEISVPRPPERTDVQTIVRPNISDLPKENVAPEISGASGKKPRVQDDSAGGGDPVSFDTGSLMLSPVDLSFPGPVWPLRFQRYYDSRTEDRSTLGSNWRHNFDVRLVRITRANAPAWAPRYCLGPHKNANGEPILLASNLVTCILLREPENSTLFYYESMSGLYLPMAGSTETLRVLPGDDPGWAVRSAEGRMRIFNELGYLTEDRDRFGNGFEIEYVETPLYRLYRRYCSADSVFRQASGFDDEVCTVLGRMFGDANLWSRPIVLRGVNYSLPVDILPGPVAEARTYYRWLAQHNMTVESVTGTRKLRPVRITGDLGRELQFDYYWPEVVTTPESFNDMPHAGLLKTVRGPAGTSIEFSYDQPADYPAVLNEMFLVSVQRSDEPANLDSVQASIDKTFLYQYQWPEYNAHSYNLFVDDVRDKYLRFFASFTGCAEDGSGAKTCAIPTTPVRAGDPCWLAELRTNSYISSVADNVLDVTFQDQTDLESRFDPNPNHADLFDRVVMQRFGGAAVDSDEVGDEDSLGSWATSLPLYRIDYKNAGPDGSENDLTDTFLPREIKDRYELESGHEPLEPVPACGEDGSGCIGEDLSDQQLPVCSAETDDVPASLDIEMIRRLGIDAALRLVRWEPRPCRPDLTEQKRAELPSHRRLFKYYETAGEIVDHPTLRRSRLTCSQIAEAQLGNPSHNDLMHIASDDVDSAFEAVVGGRARLERDARRICMWVKDTDADGLHRYHGLNYRGQTLVFAEPLNNESPGEAEYVYTESLFNADGRVVVKRRPTAGQLPWTGNAGFTAYRYHEINPKRCHLLTKIEGCSEPIRPVNLKRKVPAPSRCILPARATDKARSNRGTVHPEVEVQG